MTAHLTKGKLTWRESLTKLMARLDGDMFARISRSCAISWAQTESVDLSTREAHMKDGTVLPVSAAYARSIGSRATARG